MSEWRPTWVHAVCGNEVRHYQSTPSGVAKHLEVCPSCGVVFPTYGATIERAAVRGWLWWRELRRTEKEVPDDQ